MENRSDRLSASLDALVSSSRDLVAGAVVSFDGLPMVSNLPSGMDEDRVGAMSAAMLSLGEQAAAILGRGELKQLFIEGTNGFVFLISAKDEAVVMVVSERAAKIGFVLYELTQAADTIGGILGTGSDKPPSVPGDRVRGIGTAPAAAAPADHDRPAGTEAGEGESEGEDEDEGEDGDEPVTDFGYGKYGLGS